MFNSKPRPGASYAMPNFASYFDHTKWGGSEEFAIDPMAEAKTKAIADILRTAFAQSGTRIKDCEAIDSAARHIVQSERLKIELKNGLPAPANDGLFVPAAGPA